MIQLLIWKAGMVFWDRRQTFADFSALVNIHLPIRDTDTEVWIAKCNDWREWKPIVFECYTWKNIKAGKRRCKAERE